jgi:epoxyqueuosine reductase
VLEREWAQRSGIGWIAKNTMLINRRLGSELFLGLLLTDVELRPDEPVPEHCGTCTACLDACPTDALVQPGTLDSRKCIAYLTVEHRSPIPDDLSGSAGVMVAGCDICQEVCPWTRRAPADLHPEFAPRRDRYRPSIADLEAMTEDDYRHWRQGSSLNRIAYAQFVRNVAVARKNSRPDGESPVSTTS